LGFIEDIVYSKCKKFDSFCDIFAGTGVVGNHFNNKHVKIISNDNLYSNFVVLKSFLGTRQFNLRKVQQKIQLLNNIKVKKDNYFSKNFGNRYFSLENARKIGAIREKIEKISDNKNEKYILITSLLYAVDKIANTVGHYDAYRLKLDNFKKVKLLVPDISPVKNKKNKIYSVDTNQLIKNITFDVLYIDPPYNSRQYCDSYHLLENLASWRKPIVYGKAKKMDRSKLKSKYCLKSAAKVFSDLIKTAKCKHILVSYNNTGETKDGRSNARIKDQEIVNILGEKGKVEVLERKYKAFTTGRSNDKGHTERIFYCKVY
jgi:adenine-specific DNA-methyltransferase